MNIHSETFGSGKQILYLHGWGASGDIFRPVVQQLPNYLNITVDFAGFGQSPMPDCSGLTVSDYAEQIAQLLTERKVGKATLVAHSFGCRVSLVLAATRPELVDGMILFAPAGLRRKSFVRWCKVRVYKLRKKLFGGKPRGYASADYLSTPDALKSTFVKVVNQDLSPYARKIRCKTLIVAAKQDAAVPYKDAVRLGKLIKNADFTAVDGDHFALFYAPESYAEIVRLFMEEA